MKLRLLSDLHLDVNKAFPLDLGDNGVFTLIAGDISGDPAETIEWLKKNVKRGAFCAGNHLVYNDRKLPIEKLKEQLHSEFPENSDVTFFDYDVGVVSKEICDGVLLVSDVMYTDYSLPIRRYNERGDREANMRMCSPDTSRAYMNDFVWGVTKKKMYEKTGKDGLPDGLWFLRPKYYLEHNLSAWEKVSEIVEKNPDKQIVLMTHHCLSPRCISEDYVSDSLNASYVTDREKWIEDHPNVRLILSGHVHHRTSFKMGNALYVLNPLGYCRRDYIQCKRGLKPGDWRNRWTPNCFVDTNTWELTYEEWDSSEWDRKLDAYYKAIHDYGIFF